MKTLKTFLFVGLITAFSSTAFAQGGPEPTKFGVETGHQVNRENPNSSIVVNSNGYTIAKTNGNKSGKENSNNVTKDFPVNSVLPIHHWSEWIFNFLF